MIESIKTALKPSPTPSAPAAPTIVDRFSENSIVSFPVKPLSFGVRFSNKVIDLFQRFTTWLKSLWVVDDRIIVSATGADKKTNYLTVKKRAGYFEVVETTFSKPELIKGVFHRLFAQKIAEMNRKGETCFVVAFAPKFSASWLKEKIATPPGEAKFPDYIFRLIDIVNEKGEYLNACRVFNKSELV